MAPISKNKKHWTSLVIFVLVMAVMVTLNLLLLNYNHNEKWFDTLKPAFAPTHNIFGTIYTAIYAFIAIAGWCVFIAPAKKSQSIRQHQKALKDKVSFPFLIPMALLAINLVLNLIWAILFFYFHLLEWSFAEILILWICCFALALAFFRIRSLAGILLLPYLGWVSFLTLINLSMWRLNS
jgi:tryptophan-rich sensory protein